MYSSTLDPYLISQEIISEGWMNKEQWEYCAQKALELFAFGQVQEWTRLPVTKI
jgi:hypothetical protein